MSTERDLWEELIVENYYRCTVCGSVRETPLPRASMREQIDFAIEMLQEEDNRIIRLYLSGRTLSQIGADCSISRQQVGNRIKTIIKKIKRLILR